MGIKSKSLLDDNGFAVVKISIGETIKEAAIDTCAIYNAISPLLIFPLYLTPSGEKEVNHPVAGVSIQQEFKIEFKLEGRDTIFTDEFVTMPAPFGYSILLGIQFLKR